MKNYARMVLNHLELSVNLGWPHGERVKQQIVTADVTIFFENPPKACMTDQLADTYCYDTLIDKIKNCVALRHFRLLEHLAYEIYHIVKQLASANARVHVALTKKPAILNLTGGITFCYG